ncbi:MAG: hypothetical protein ACR2JF_11895 [Iamia sp.]
MSDGPGPPFGQGPHPAPPGLPPGGGPGPYGSPGDGQPAYGQPAYGQPGYGYPGYGYGGPPQEEHPQGTIVLIFGILGIVACQVLSPIAWVMGNRTLAEIDAAPGRYSNRSLVNAGRICGIVGSVLLGIIGAIFLVYFVIIIGVVVSAGA